MGISTELARQFAKSTIDKDKTKTGKTVNGTAVLYNGKIYVKIDGSDQITPIISSTAGIRDGDRVTVLVKDHTMSITGNTSSPSVGQGDIDDSHQDIIDEITELEILVADKASIKDLEVEQARVDYLMADNVVIREKLTANEAEIKRLDAEKATIEELNAQEAEIDNLKATKLDVEIADIKYATIEKLEATDANIHNLQADYGDFKVLATEKFTAQDAVIEDLETGKLSAEDADLKYANIDFANIGKAAIETFFAKSGMIGDLVVGEGTITGTLVGVTIKGDLIEGGTVKADKLVIKGEDGLYYKLNTNGETVEAQQTEQNSLDGSIITAKSITATKISVNDLVAFDATIGGFNITENSLYSGVKETVDNNTRGVYLDDTGQVAFGDQYNYLKYYQDDKGTWKLAISAESLSFGSSKKPIEDYISEEVKDSVGMIEAGTGRNYLRYTEEFPIGSANAAEDGISSYIDNSRLERTEEGVKYTYSSAANDGITIPFVHDGCIEAGDQTTLSFKYRGNLSKFGSLYFLQRTPPNSIAQMEGTPVKSDTEWQEYRMTFTMPNANSGVNYMLLFLVQFEADNAEGEWIEIKRGSLKLEKGSQATDWTPAFEDLATDSDVQNAQSTADNANGKVDDTINRVVQAESTIEMLNNSISSMVTDSNGSSLMTQTSDGWTFNIGGIQSSLNQAVEDLTDVRGDVDEANAIIEKTSNLVDEISAKTAYIVMTTDDNGDPCIELGKEGNPFKVRITNTSVDFIEENNRIAYISNQALYIEKTIIKNELQIGSGQGFVWKQRSNGNMGLRWMEVSG